MRVFISSVRRGLEEERDALPGLVEAIGHRPVRFEDFTAQQTPSREACLAGVAASDVYVLLLGPYYGHAFEDTGQSPTHDEWMAAQQRGLPRLVFRKEGVAYEPAQQHFIESISDYASGVFYDTFTSTSDLQTKVARALRELDTVTDPLTFTPLAAPMSVPWRPIRTGSTVTTDPAGVEVYVLPVPAAALRPARVMTELEKALPARLRAADVLDPAKAIETRLGEGVVESTVLFERARFNEIRTPQLLSVRVGADGHVACRASLPGDSMGAVLDAGHLGEQIAGLLRLVGQLKLLQSPQVALAAAVTDVGMLSLGPIAQSPRSSATRLMTSQEPLHVEPDEAMSLAALDVGAAEAGQLLASSMIRIATQQR